MLQVGFARIDITTPLGTEIVGYYEKRVSDGVIDPLLASAVAFDNGEKKAIVMSVDVIGISQLFSAHVRGKIAEKLGMDADAIMINATHTHTGPLILGVTDIKYAYEHTIDEILEDEVARAFEHKLIDVAVLAMADLAPAKMLYTRGVAEDVTFIRRYRMKDGTTRTNPGWQNPDIEGPIGEADENSSLLIIKREGKKEIGIVNFQVHPDLIGRTRYSADYPKFVRDTYEANIPDSLCMYINGAAGNLNHIDVRRNPDVDVCCKGYERAMYMGKKIAMSVLMNYPLAKELSGEKIGYAQRDVEIKYNKGKPEEIDDAIALYNVYIEKGADAAVPGGNAGMRRTQLLAKVSRIVALKDRPDTTELRVSAISVGEVVFGGLPGEPFTELGRAFKDSADYTLAVFCCLSNGNQGYFPVMSAIDEGAYEANSTSYERGTAEKIRDNLIEIANNIK